MCVCVCVCVCVSVCVSQVWSSFLGPVVSCVYDAVPCVFVTTVGLLQSHQIIHEHFI